MQSQFYKGLKVGSGGVLSVGRIGHEPNLAAGAFPRFAASVDAK
jgi:hypothetical protein